MSCLRNPIQVTLAKNGKQAPELRETNDFDVIPMDCRFQVMDSYTATRKIRQNENWQDIPIFALTADA